MNVYNVGAVEPFKMDWVSMHKWVKENPYNHLEKHTPPTTQASKVLKQSLKTHLALLNGLM